MHPVHSLCNSSIKRLPAASCPRDELHAVCDFREPSVEIVLWWIGPAHIHTGRLHVTPIT